MKKNTGMPKWRINLRKQSAQEALFLHGAPVMPAAGSQGIVCVGLSAWWAPAHRCMDTTQRLLVWEWRPKLQNLYGRPWAKMTHVTTLPSDEWHYLCWVVISLWIFYLHCPFTPRKYFPYAPCITKAGFMYKAERKATSPVSKFSSKKGCGNTESGPGKIQTRFVRVLSCEWYSSRYWGLAQSLANT